MKFPIEVESTVTALVSSSEWETEHGVLYKLRVCGKHTAYVFAFANLRNMLSWSNSDIYRK